MVAGGISLPPLSTPRAPGFVPAPKTAPGGSLRPLDVQAATGAHGGPLTVRQRFLLGNPVDVNRAGYRELSGLPGISDPVAKEIVRERTRRGGFRRPEDLLAVRGIKERRLKKILPFIVILPNN